MCLSEAIVWCVVCVSLRLLFGVSEAIPWCGVSLRLLLGVSSEAIV